MKKILTIIFIICCIFSFNFNMHSYAANAEVKTEQAKDLPDLPVNNTQAEDVLSEPVFNEKEEKAEKTPNKVTGVIVKIIGAVCLFFVFLFCCSFIWFANLQRKREAKRKKQSVSTNVIDAVDNFARHRIKNNNND